MHIVILCKLTLTEATTLTGSSVVDGTGQIVLDDLLCRNNESRLVDCSHNGLGVHNCVHSDDAGVRCLPLILSEHVVIMYDCFIFYIFPWQKLAVFRLDLALMYNCVYYSFMRQSLVIVNNL